MIIAVCGHVLLYSADGSPAKPGLFGVIDFGTESMIRFIKPILLLVNIRCVRYSFVLSVCSLVPDYLWLSNKKRTIVVSKKKNLFEKGCETEKYEGEFNQTLPKRLEDEAL